MTDPPALDRGIARGIAVFRWLALGWAWAGLAFEWDLADRPGLAIIGLALATLVTVAATALLASGDARVSSTPFLVVESTVGALLLVLDGWVYTAGREQSLPWAWPAAGIIAIAVTRGARWGLRRDHQSGDPHRLGGRA
jgi:hypothetical protein